MVDPLGELVHLTSLDLDGMCVCVHAVLCPSVHGRLWQCEAV